MIARPNPEDSLMVYVDGYVIPVPKKKVAAYRKMAKIGAKAWMKHGALEYRECVGEDLSPKGMPGFPSIVKLKAGETVVFSWIVFKSRKHRDQVNARVMKDLCTVDFDPKSMPFDCKRMACGGFKVLVEG